MNEWYTHDASSQEMGERFELLAAAAREYALYMTDPEGHLLCWNPGAERLFGYRPDEAIGQHFSLFFSPKDVRNGQPEHELKAARSQGHADSVRWQVRKDGSGFWCQGTMTPLLDANKQVRGFARLMHDLTGNQLHEAETKRADDLAAANRGKEEFMALLSHELRNPLSPILNALNVLRQITTDNPIIQQAGNIIERQVGQMVRLVDDLLDISRITKGKLRLNKDRVELRVLVNRAAEAARPLIDARRHEFSVSLPTEPIWVEADPARVEQIVVNLLNNAAKYTDSCGFIWLSVSREGTEAVVRVRDNGLGIAPEMLSRIFDLFAQEEGSLSRSHGGLGIGLALVRTLVGMHDGRVTAASAGTGRGSEFTVKLPALADAPLAETLTLHEPISPAGPRRRVLVVEDNVDAADSLSLLLRLYGHEVLVARCGPSALEAAPGFRPDLILLDIGLPGMDGYEAARRLRAQPSFEGAMLCALTGYTPSEADRRRGQETGFDHHFVKPVSLETLLDLLASLAP